MLIHVYIVMLIGRTGIYSVHGVLYYISMFCVRTVDGRAFIILCCDTSKSLWNALDSF